MSTGRIDDAIAQFRTALRLKADFPQAHINLANALLAKGDYGGAGNEARIAVKLAPNDAEAHHTLGRALSFQPDLSAAPVPDKSASLCA